jgi:diguanylate cyclase (GGDEF)-like protein
MSIDFEDINKYNSELLNLLTTNLPDMLWAKDLDGKYIYVNEAICKGLLMAKDTSEPIGKGDVYFALREREAHKDNPQWHTFGELCFDSDKVVIENNKPMKFEESGNVKGKELFLEVYKAPIYDDTGNIIGVIGSGRDITELKTTQKKLQKSLDDLKVQHKKMHYQANHDALTGLANRHLLIEKLDHSINLSVRHKRKVAILFMDVDNFKEINDSLGHNVGDDILIELSQRLQSKTRKADTLARLGGDEFCILLTDVSDLEDVTNFITNIMDLLTEPFFIGQSSIYLNLSIGISIYPSDSDNVNTLMKNADSAMFKAKNDGKNRYCFYDKTMTQKAFERVFLETALREALEKDEFVVYFQPQIDARDDSLVGMEALVRWQHPVLGLVPPDKFIPLAEDTGMIVKLDRVVMQKAITQFTLWHKSGLKPGRLSLNLAMKQLETSDFIDYLDTLIQEENREINFLELEVTESQIMHNPEKSIEVLHKIHDLNISLAIDDFGTGYSSLAYLKRLPINKLKIDRSFIKDLPSDPEDIALSKTIISLCENLNLDVIAEGVETVQQKEFLLDNGCNLIQGYYYSRPLSVDKMTEYLEENFK